MSDARVSKYAVAMHAMTCDATRLPPCPVDGHLAWIRWAEAAAAMADTELAALEQECRDRECTEQDVRARLADAENTLARVRAEVQAIMGVSDDLRDRATCESIWLDLRAALDGTS